tara:strand:+ start:23 stop:196 length:174 start_codon:yes stop_codon:yes gene_type:complete
MGSTGILSLKPVTRYQEVEVRRSGLEYTSEQIDAIIQALYTLAEVEYEIISSETKDN